MRLDEAIAEIVDTLTAAGIRATADIRDLNPPGAYCVIDRLEFDGLATYTMRAFIYAVAASTGRVQAYKQLGPLLELIQKAWHCSAADHVDLPTPGTRESLPAFRLSTAVAVTLE